VAELGGHQIGTANQFLDSSPTAVLGSGGIHRFKDREVNDHVFVTLEYPGGRPTGIEITERTDNAVLDASESRAADAARRRAGSAAHPAAAGAADDGLLPYRLEIPTFCSAVRTGQALQCGVDMAFKTTLACLAANRAMDTRQRVEIPRLA
jgi:predicted dehydrogenase